MSEQIVTGYQRLFEVRLLHHYWLDNGLELFDNLSDTQKNSRLLQYDSRNFCTITPTLSTEKKLRSLNGVFRNTALGLLVAIPKATQVADDDEFEFYIQINKADFNNYTALTLAEKKITECYLQVEENTVTYRFKENVPVFSNLTGTSRGSGSGKTLYLSFEIPSAAAEDKVEYFNLSGSNLYQLAGDQPGATTQLITASASDYPVFVNQADTPILVPPSGVTGTPARGIRLTSELPDDVFGLIRIIAKHPSDNDFSCTSGGMAKSHCPVFQIRFKNRSAIWRYLNKNTGELILESSETLPLTFSGNASSRQKPSNLSVKAKHEDDDFTKKILNLYIDIYE
jgi:hypothetical protein